MRAVHERIRILDLHFDTERLRRCEKSVFLHPGSLRDVAGGVFDAGQARFDLVRGVGVGELTRLPHAIEHRLVHLVADAECLVGVVRALIHRPVLARQERRGHISELRICRQCRLQFLDDRLELITGRAAVREHLSHFDFVRRNAGVLRRSHYVVVFPLHPLVGGMGTHAEGQREQGTHHGHGSGHRGVPSSQTITAA